MNLDLLAKTSSLKKDILDFPTRGFFRTKKKAANLRPSFFSCYYF